MDGARNLARYVCVACVFLIASSASAQSESLGVIGVRADAGLSCPTSSELEARVDGLLGTRGRAVERMRETNIGLMVTFARDATGVRADVELHGARSGRRTLHEETSDCAELSATVALALAILIDPSFVPPAEEQNTSEPAQAATKPTTQPPQPTGRTQPEQARAPAPPPTQSTQNAEAAEGSGTFGAVFGGVGIASGVAGPIALALGGGIDFGWKDSLGVRLGATWTPGSSVNLPPGTVEVTAFSGSLDACARVFTLGSRTTLSPCAGVSVGFIEARARGYTQDGEARRAWYAASAGLALDVPLTRVLGAWLEAKTLWPLRRQSFEIGGVGVVHPMNTPGVLVLLGPSLLLW
jgi:hypothetical protein